MSPTPDPIPSDIRLMMDQFLAGQSAFTSLMKYCADFFNPYLVSSSYFTRAQLPKMLSESPTAQWKSYMNLMAFCLELFSKGFNGSVQAMDQQARQTVEQFVKTMGKEWDATTPEKLKEFISRQFNMVQQVEKDLPRAVEQIKQDFGFHFEQTKNALIQETDRFYLYQVHPSDPSITTDRAAKPILIIPPFVLGSNILSFLPGEQKSYAHSFANKGLPTYIRVMKDIHATPAVQTMTREQDTLDTRQFCQTLKAAHGRMVTLNGYCQGGYSAVCSILSNELDHLVDALITCVAPMDGTRSRGLGNFLKGLPPEFNDLLYGTKTLSNGNQVADGQLMGWVYKLKSIDTEAPLAAFLRDMNMVEAMKQSSGSISKTAAVLNYWLKYERTDIPMAITEMSFASYNIPVSEDGTLPVTLFDRKLNFKGIEEKKIPWLLCYGEADDLVEPEAALAPADFIHVEAVPYPKGHVAIATSWSHPESEYALDQRFGPNSQYRGPVRFQMDLNDALNQKDAAEIKTDSPVSTAPELNLKPSSSKNPSPAAEKKATLPIKTAKAQKTATIKKAAEKAKPTASKPLTKKPAAPKKKKTVRPKTASKPASKATSPAKTKAKTKSAAKPASKETDTPLPATGKKKIPPAAAPSKTKTTQKKTSVAPKPSAGKKTKSQKKNA